MFQEKTRGLMKGISPLGSGGGGAAAASGRYFVYINKVCVMRDNFAFRPQARASRWVSIPGGSRRGKRREGCFCPSLCHKRTFCLCLYCGLCFGWEKSKGRSRNWLRGCHLLPSVFFVFICSRRRPGVTSVAELRSAVLMGFLLGPEPRASFCGACAGLVCPPSAVLPRPRQVSAARSEVAGRGREGRGGRNLGIYLILGQQPGTALCSSVI